MRIFVYPPCNLCDKRIENGAFLLHFAFRFVTLSTVLFDDKNKKIIICFVVCKLICTFAIDHWQHVQV